MLRIIRSADYAVRPWKNGGGTTRDIVVAPAGASLDDFHWRLSLAQVDRDGPFSRFDNVDRTLVLLDGAMTLHEPGGRIVLARGEPVVFEGERAIAAALEGGPTLDFNVMTRRGSVRHTVRREVFGRNASVEATQTRTIILFALDGGLEVDDVDLDSHDTAVVCAHRANVAAAAGTAATLVVEIDEIHPNVL